MNEVDLDSIMQADETYSSISYKGHHKNFNLPRSAYKRGIRATKCGISK